MNATVTATVIDLGMVIAAFILHRLTLAGPLANIWARRDRTRGMYTNAEKLFNEIRLAATILLRIEEEQTSEHARHVLALLDEEHLQRDQAPVQAIRESRWRIRALLLTTPAYVHVWREYRTAQILLDRATRQLIRIKYEIGVENGLLVLQSIGDLIGQYEQAVVGNMSMEMCLRCQDGQEYLCSQVEKSHDGPVPHLTCWQRTLLLATAPQKGDWAYKLLQVSK